MTYPIILHINDVLPAIDARDEFVVGKRDGYQFIDYNYALPDSFDCQIRRECRGLKFDMDGKLIARPFHKFFNLHERPEDIPTAWDGVVVMEKLDGSMVHPARVNGELVFMTRAGISDQAKLARAACQRLPYGKAILDFCANAVTNGFTPIFEFTSPQNQIVVRYATEALTLLALRRNDNGYYMSRWLVETEARRYGFPHVRTFDHSLSDLDAFVRHVRELKGMEGYVVRLGQHLIKVKGDEYVAAHKARSGLLWEKDVLRLVLENKIDDVAALLPDDEANRLQLWEGEVNKGVSAAVTILRALIHAYGELPRHEFAHVVKERFAWNKLLPSMLFSTYDGHDPRGIVVALGLKQTTNANKARAFLEYLGVKPWQAPRVELDG